MLTSCSLRPHDDSAAGGGIGVVGVSLGEAAFRPARRTAQSHCLRVLARDAYARLFGHDRYGQRIGLYCRGGCIVDVATPRYRRFVPDMLVGNVRPVLIKILRSGGRADGTVVVGGTALQYRAQYRWVRVRREIRGRARQSAVFAGVLLLLILAVALSIWASYGFRYAMINPKLDQFDTSPPWNNVEFHSPLANRAVDIAREYRLLPEAYLYGFSHVMHASEGSNAFLNGEFRRFGWLSFYPYCFAAKTPVQFFLLLAIAVAAIWRYPFDSGQQTGGKLAGTATTFV